MAETANTRKSTVKPEVNFPDLRKFIAWKEAQMATPIHGGRLGGAIGVQQQAVRVILSILSDLAGWMEDGCPEPVQVLTEGDKQFWREARGRGVLVPPDIDVQL